MKKILIAGGDMRQIYCGKKLAEKYSVSVMGFDREYIPKILGTADISKKNLYDSIILPVSAENDSGGIYTPCFSGKTDFSDVKEMLKPDGTVFHGRISGEHKKIFTNTCDYSAREDFCMRNAVPTAEGAVKTALEELPVTLCGLKILIVGMGRIGTVLVRILQGFGADITVAVRNSNGSAKAYAAGVKSVCTAMTGTDYRLVFNTVPSMIFTRDILSRFNRDTLFIDLASKPGGIDFGSASELGMHVIWALGIPGKTAPVTAGEIIADTIEGIFSERGD